MVVWEKDSIKTATKWNGKILNSLILNNLFQSEWRPTYWNFNESFHLAFEIRNARFFFGFYRGFWCILICTGRRRYSYQIHWIIDKIFVETRIEFRQSTHKFRFGFWKRTFRMKSTKYSSFSAFCILIESNETSNIYWVFLYLYSLDHKSTEPNIFHRKIDEFVTNCNVWNYVVYNYFCCLFYPTDEQVFMFNLLAMKIFQIISNIEMQIQMCTSIESFCPIVYPETKSFLVGTMCFNFTFSRTI